MLPLYLNRSVTGNIQRLLSFCIRITFVDQLHTASQDISNSSRPPLRHPLNNPWYNSTPVCFWVCHVDKTANDTKLSHGVVHVRWQKHLVHRHILPQCFWTDANCQSPFTAIFTQTLTDTQSIGHLDILLPLLEFWLLEANWVNCLCN
jgi:hypothetical protein